MQQTKDRAHTAMPRRSSFNSLSTLHLDDSRCRGAACGIAKGRREGGSERARGGGGREKKRQEIQYLQVEIYCCQEPEI